MRRCESRSLPNRCAKIVLGLFELALVDQQGAEVVLNVGEARLEIGRSAETLFGDVSPAAAVAGDTEQIQGIQVIGMLSQMRGKQFGSLPGPPFTQQLLRLGKF